MSLDEAYLYLNVCNKNKYYNIKWRNKNVQTRFQRLKEGFRKGLKNVPKFYYTRVLKIRRERILKSTQCTIERKFYVRYYRRNFIFYSHWLSKKELSLKQNYQVVFRKVSLRSLKEWRLIQMLHMYLFNVFLQISLATGENTCGLLCLWSVEKSFSYAQIHHEWWALESSGSGLKISISVNFTIL